jgi:hypothetical protein
MVKLKQLLCLRQSFPTSRHRTLSKLRHLSNVLLREPLASNRQWSLPVLEIEWKIDGQSQWWIHSTLRSICEPFLWLLYFLWYLLRVVTKVLLYGKTENNDEAFCRPPTRYIVPSPTMCNFLRTQYFGDEVNWDLYLRLPLDSAAPTTAWEAATYSNSGAPDEGGVIASNLWRLFVELIPIERHRLTLVFQRKVYSFMLILSMVIKAPFKRRLSIV